jgi:Icc-related predicted phosphoesterase
MRLVLTSDLHGHLPEVPPCDALLIAGDVCPIENHDLEFQADWLRTTFCPWLRGVPARQKVFIAGNHDFVFAHDPAAVMDIAWPGVYLQDNGLEWEEVAIWGSPWANELPGWPFTAPEEDLVNYWQRIPDDTQVLLVHGPPHGIGDLVVGRYSGTELHVGSRSLLKRIEQLSDLSLVICGHIHEGAGIYQHGPVTIVNAALMSVNYAPIQPLRVFELMSA